MTYAKLLTIQFQGYFLCRLATDPDPTNEARGVSGYTMSLLGEDELDAVIRTQVSPAFAKKNLREPAERMGIQIGVNVTGVSFDGDSYPPGNALLGAKVYLEGKNEPFDGPTYDSRNNIVGSDDNMAFVVNPFELAIRGDGVSIFAKDYLNPADPEQKIWKIEDPALYARRLPTAFSSSSTEVMAILRVFDQFSYFRDRRRYLTERIEQLEKKLAAGDPGNTDREGIQAKIQALKTRIYQIEFWGDRVSSKLAFQLTYSHNNNGPQRIEGLEKLKGQADTHHPWPVTYWFGGWDGDLLTGYMAGTLGIPFLPA
ncbi:MAG TPA: hypothetical protein VFE33_27830 [Thermoanaerobaculia bacterium]|nr:hypothetical protein [Thermoanaerobaculia bacterium]